MGILVYGLVFTFIYGVVVWIVGVLIGFGLEVKGFGAALIAGLLITVGNFAISMFAGVLLPSGVGTFVSAIVATIIVMMICGKIVPGIRVTNFAGVLLPALVVGFISWLIPFVAGGQEMTGGDNIIVMFVGLLLVTLMLASSVNTGLSKPSTATPGDIGCLLIALVVMGIITLIFGVLVLFMVPYMIRGY